MNNLDKIFDQANNAEEFSKDYMQYLAQIITTKIDFESVSQFIDALLEARNLGKNIFFIGNGGSAATASHMANDFGIGTRTDNPPFRAIALTDNNAVMTAIGNDFGYDELFSKQLEKLAQEGDLVVAISASGNSSNILKGIEVAKAKSCKVVGLSGFDGGKLKQLSDISIHIPTEKGEYGPVEDAHMVIDHLVGSYLNRVIRQ